MRSRVSCSGKRWSTREVEADVFGPSMPEFVKLGIGKMSGELRAHIFGANDILSGRESPAVGTAR